jgi:hypothetical protein
MKNILQLIILSVLVILIACNKDKFTTAPQVKIKNISPANVLNGNLIELKGSFTDDEGDLDSVYIVYKYYNGATATKTDTFRNSYESLGVPANTRSAEITVSYTYNQSNPPYLPGVNKDTTASLGLLLIDKAGQRSNYAESEKIRLIKP